MGTVLDKEMQTFRDNRRELLDTARGKFVLIKDDCILGVFDTRSEAIEEGDRLLGNVAFLAQEVTEQENVLNGTFIEPIFAHRNDMLSTEDEKDQWSRQTTP